MAKPLEISAIACLTFNLLLTDGPIIGLPEYKLKVVNICKIEGTGGLKVEGVMSDEKVLK